jgi:hypothetical protein
MVTASHNPSEDNGFKFVLKGKSLTPEQIQADIGGKVNAIGMFELSISAKKGFKFKVYTKVSAEGSSGKVSFDDPDSKPDAFIAKVGALGVEVNEDGDVKASLGASAKSKKLDVEAEVSASVTFKLGAFMDDHTLNRMRAGGYGNRSGHRSMQSALSSQTGCEERGDCK